MFIIEAPAWLKLSEYVTLEKTFYILLFKQEVVVAQLLLQFAHYRIPR
jgi:hypothetical protein